MASTRKIPWKESDPTAYKKAVQFLIVEGDKIALTGVGKREFFSECASRSKLPVPLIREAMEDRDVKYELMAAITRKEVAHTPKQWRQMHEWVMHRQDELRSKNYDAIAVAVLLRRDGHKATAHSAKEVMKLARLS